jgi:HPt (histidine-containing phosphotransfer) domain-containing protein
MNPPRAELDALLAEYRANLPATLARIDALLGKAKYAELARELHTLAGSAGTFGLPEVGTAAAAAEAYLEACGCGPDDRQRAELQQLLARIRHASCTA